MPSNNNKNRKIFKKAIKKNKKLIYLLFVAILLYAICCLKPEIYVFIHATITYVCFIIFIIAFERTGEVEMQKKLTQMSLDIDKTAQSTIMNFPFPLVIVEKKGDLVWKSSKYIKEFENNDDIDDILDDIIKELNKKIETDKENDTYDALKERVEIGDKTYRVIGEYIQTKEGKDEDYLEQIYFMDETSKINLLRKYSDSKICVGILMIDNYEDILQRVSEDERSSLLLDIEKEIYNWANRYEALCLKTERDRFTIVFEQKQLEAMKESKFEIIDDIKKIETEQKVQATLSIAVSVDGETNVDKYYGAKEVLDIALGRGGDQAIIKQEEKYVFFGGRTPEVEKRTKVKARVVSAALEELMSTSSRVFVMGHTNSDMDAMGACMGIYRLATANNKEAYIVNNLDGTTLNGFVQDINKEDEYKNVIINGSEAKAKIDADSLLIVVDTYRSGYVEVPELLDETNKIVVVDHHRRATDYIEKAILSFHEVYASSACELVTELIEYSKKEIELTKVEAESLFAGIMMDTKNFTYKTGVRTFEAAAYLRKCGIDVIRIKKWFQSDLYTFRRISEIVSKAEMLYDSIAISVYDGEEEDNNIVAAKAADELLTVNNITASFTLCKQDDKVFISGRSIGEINVQVILEKLGGGGHITMAGAQVADMTIEETKQELINRINEYFAEEE